MDNKFEIVVKTMQGLEEILANEIEEIGGEEIQILKRAVSFMGDIESVYKANLYLRTALRVLIPIYSFKVRDENSLYEKVQEIDWNDYISYKDTIAIDSAVSSPYFNHANYVSLKTKDAIVDQFRDATGKRPSIDIERPTLRINVHISNSDCTLSIDSSGYSLHKRGWRVSQNDAPLNEVLAAGMILISGWDKISDFYDPFCGSGTILMEANAIARNIPPGINGDFAFKRLNDFDDELWDKILTEAENNILPEGPKIYGSDISVKALDISGKNIEYAEMRGQIKISLKDFEDMMPIKNEGIVITNPPYGERLQLEDAQAFYKMIGDKMKKDFDGFNFWILSGNMEAFKFIGLKPSKKRTLFNGTIECKFHKFEIYSGSKKAKKQVEL